ncbi:serine hydrolase [Poseidonocella sp. HB161398]|uniref:serine hydrolase domain-containing protein n=1 Tax=Poseidonocella sp. HB161398 TaxID=2320855 RepID=UPI0014863B96|nr:serine hydrolase domain-containing protein [Poseidonocella sp. HB161398]
MTTFSRAGFSRSRRRPAAVLAVLSLALALSGQAARADLAGDIQTMLDSYLDERSGIEGNTGASVFVGMSGSGPDIAVYSGTTSREGGSPVTGNTLFQIGSNTKGFTGALMLALEERGKLSIEDTVGDWLPQYAAWKDVTIAELLHMISGIPTYSESPQMNEAFVNTPDRHFAMEELVAFADPLAGAELPPNSGYFYSNTNYLLAGMIAEKASGMSYREALETLLFAPAGLSDTYYEEEAYTGDVLARMSSGYFNNPACTLYEPDCETGALVPLIGRDVKADDVSWAGPAGGIVGSPRELATWIRALFDGKVLSEASLARFVQPVSLKTGEPIADVTEDDPAGFTLGIVRITGRGLEPMYYYLGMTLGYRVAFLFSPEDDLIVSAATNSQPPEGEDGFLPLMIDLYKTALAEKTQAG